VTGTDPVRSGGWGEAMRTSEVAVRWKSHSTEMPFYTLPRTRVDMPKVPLADRPPHRGKASPFGGGAWFLPTLPCRPTAQRGSRSLPLKETPERRRYMTNATAAQPSGTEEMATIFAPGAWSAGFPDEGKVKTLLSSIVALDEWLDRNEGRTDDEVRLRHMMRW
jgi:hypothetical protein